MRDSVSIVHWQLRLRLPLSDGDGNYYDKNKKHHDENVGNTFSQSIFEGSLFRCVGPPGPSSPARLPGLKIKFAVHFLKQTYCVPFHTAIVFSRFHLS